MGHFFLSIGCLLVLMTLEIMARDMKFQRLQGVDLSELTMAPPASNDPDDPWRPHNLTEIPHFDDDDTIEVLLVYTPLMKWTLGDILKYFNMYHGAIAFRSKKTGKTWQTEYDGLPTMIKSTLPEIVVDNTTGTRDLKWTSYGGSLIFMPLFEGYWENVTVVATMSGKQHSYFISDYMSKVNTTHPIYNLWNILDNETRERYLESYDCWDFVYDTFDYLYSIGVQFNSTQKAMRCDGNWHVREKPTPVELNDPKHHDLIIDYYELLSLKFKDLKPFDIITELANIIIGRHVYIYDPHIKQYYLLDLVKPYYKYEFNQHPLPGAQGYRPKRSI